MPQDIAFVSAKQEFDHFPSVSKLIQCIQLCRPVCQSDHAYTMNNLKRSKERYKTTIAKELPQQNSKKRGKTAKLIYVAAGIFAF